VCVDQTDFGNIKINWHSNTIKNPKNMFMHFFVESFSSLRMVKEVATGIVLGGRK